MQCKSNNREQNAAYQSCVKTEALFCGSAGRILRWTGTTPSGYVLDETWQPNDGLVNTVSAIAPYNAPRTTFDRTNIQPGIWNVLPTYQGDHMGLEGGFFKTDQIRPLYFDLLCTINGLS